MHTCIHASVHWIDIISFVLEFFDGENDREKLFSALIKRAFGIHIPRSSLDGQYYRCDFTIYGPDRPLGLHKSLCSGYVPGGGGLFDDIFLYSFRGSHVHKVVYLSINDNV